MAASYDQGAFWLIVGHRRKQVTSIEGAQNTPAEARIGGNVRNPTVLRARQLTKSVNQHLLSHATNARDAREVIGCAGTVVERFLELIKNLPAPNKLGGVQPSVGLDGLELLMLSSIRMYVRPAELKQLQQRLAVREEPGARRQLQKFLTNLLKPVLLEASA